MIRTLVSPWDSSSVGNICLLPQEIWSFSYKFDNNFIKCFSHGKVYLTNLYICCLRDSLQIQRQTHTVSTGMEKGIPCNANEKTAHVQMQQRSHQTKQTLSKDCDMRQRRTFRTQGSIRQEETPTVNTQASNAEAPK